jgi:hypothetical protein
MSGITIAHFRGTMPAFADAQIYTDAAIDALLILSDTSMPVDRWGEIRDYGQALFTAHFLVLAERDRRTAEAGGIPGAVTGAVSSKGVGGASLSYDISSVVEKDGGHWNSTSFGIQWLRYARLIGMGGLQDGGPDVLLGPTFGSPWAGVQYWGF